MRSSILRSKNLFIRAITHTDMGCVRRNNEDNAGFTFIKGSKNDFIAMLADGMGGYERGEEASEAMIHEIFTGTSQKIDRNPRRWLLNMLQKANSDICTMSQQQGVVMGTTCTTLLIWRKRVWCAHIGDSRIYLLSKGKLRQLTDDHTVVGAMMREGALGAAEAAVHPKRSVLTKAIGTGARIEPDIFKLQTTLRRGDRFLLCSDGLYDLVSDAEICTLLSQTSLRKAAASLTDTAKRKGGYDNITVVIVEIDKKKGENSDEA